MVTARAPLASASLPLSMVSRAVTNIPEDPLPVLGSAPIGGLEVARLLRRSQDAIVVSWLRLAETLLKTGRAPEPAEDLGSWACQSLDALVEALAGAAAPTGQAAGAGLQRLLTAHPVAEVAAGLLLCRQAALPFVRASVAGTGSACGVGSLDSGLVELLIQLTRQTVAARPERSEHQAIVEERQRLARELHDSVAQSLYTVTLYADAAGLALAANEPEHIREHLHDLRQTAQEALRDMRLIIFDLRPSELLPGGLPEAVAHRLEIVEAHVGLQTRVTVEGHGPLPFSVEEELYRIIQEALNNVIKHARASRVEVRLSFGPNEARLEISDDGLGFDPDQPAVHRGLGLDDMAARAQRIGARMEISSGSGVGTTLRLRIPRTE